MTIYSATARLNGKDAGHVAYGRTADEARAKAAKCPLPVAIRRERGWTPEAVAKLTSIGKL